jgi:hypothetical protein
VNAFTTTVPLLALGFGNLAMLGWLAAAAAPLLIHLWSRRKYREVPWAAVTFLLAAMRRSARRIQLQQWLLLAVRTLIIVLVVLAVAEPYGTGSLAGGPSGAPAHNVIVIDGSYSMAARVGEATLFEHSKRLAAELVRESGPGDSFTVILLAEPAATILGRDVIDQAAVASQIESLPQPHTGGDLARALSLVDEALDDADRWKTDVRKEVYVFSDLQRVSWSEAAVAERLGALAKRARLVAIDVSAGPLGNLAVTQLSLADPYVTTSGETTIEGTLHQFGAQPRNDCVVELVIDDVPVAEQKVSVPAGGDASVRFAYRFRTAGEHAVSLRANADALPLDDTRWLIAPARDDVRVLCVEGKSGAAKYLADALDPDPADSSPVRPEIVSDGDLAELELAEFDCVFLCNVARLTASEFERVSRYAATGGGVVVFLGDRVQAEAYNAAPSGGVWRNGGASFNSISDFGFRIAELQSGSESAIRNPQSAMETPKERVEALLPVRIGDVVNQHSFSVDPLEYRHPIVAPFRGRERAGLLTTPIARYYRLTVLPDRAGAEVVAALAAGDPWIVAAPVGRGRVVVVATDGSLTSIDAETTEPWTAWPTWPSFLPLVREMLAYAVGGQRDVWQQPVGSPLSPRGRESQQVGESVDILRPDGRTAAVQVESGGDGGVWSYDGTDRSGIYSARAARESDRRLFAVNVDTRESDLAKIEPQQLPPEMFVSSRPDAGGEGVTGEFSSEQGWQQSLLFAAFGLLLVESLMAWHFGRGTL